MSACLIIVIFNKIKFFVGKKKHLENTAEVLTGQRLP